MNHIFDTKADIHRTANLVNNLPEQYSDLMLQALVIDVDNLIMDSSMSLEECCEYAIEAKKWTVFELAILLNDVYEEYEADDDGMDLDDFFDCTGDYVNDQLATRLKGLWQLENPQEVR